ncbi:MAG: DUF2953 domain-containing protein [Lachnospiraceae bacterium]|jgi:hypothetical protein|nr:DUF2953 domain-containing protein [Lachnospiraceae bacterium]
MQTALWVGLGTLKILGLILLGILAFFLVLLVLILVVPLRYRIQGSYDGKLMGQMGVSWLCHLLWVKAVYKEKLTVAVRILGIRVFRMEKTFGKETEESLEEDLKAAGSADGYSDNQTAGGLKESRTWEEEESCPQKPSETRKTPEENFREEISQRPEPDSGESVKHSHKKSRRHAGMGQRQKEKSKEKQGFSFSRVYDKLKKKLLESFKKIRIFLKRFHGMIAELLMKKEMLAEKKEKLCMFMKDEKNRRTWKLLKRQVGAICRHILPTKITGQVKFGFDDPYTTGQVLTYLSMIYSLYAKSFKVIPVFEESVIEGQGKIKGRIRIGTLIVLVVRMLFDKNFRSWIRKLRKS